MRYLSTFSGIGGFELGITQAYEALCNAHGSEKRGIKKIRRETKDRDYSPRRGKVLVPRKDQLVQALQTSLTKDHYVLVTPKSIGMHARFIKSNSPLIKTMVTSQKSKLKNCQTLTSSSEDSLVRLSVLLESGEDLKIPEGLCSLSLQEFCELNNLDYSSLKTLKGFSAMTMAELSKPSSPRLMSWGTTFNGKCLTAKTTESHKTESEYSLSDILEERPDPKYFLSNQMAERILMGTIK